MNIFDDFNLDIVKITKMYGTTRTCPESDQGSSDGGGTSGSLASITCVSDCVCITDYCVTMENCKTYDGVCDPEDPWASQKVCR